MVLDDWIVIADSGRINTFAAMFSILRQFDASTQGTIRPPTIDWRCLRGRFPLLPSLPTLPPASSPESA